MENKIILKAEDLDGYLTKEDQSDLNELEVLFKETMQYFEPKNEQKIIEGYDKMGHKMQEICKKHPKLKFILLKLMFRRRLKQVVSFQNCGTKKLIIRNLFITVSGHTKCFLEWLTQINILTKKVIL